MRVRLLSTIGAFLALALVSNSQAGDRDGNRLAYLDDSINPYYVGLGFPRLVTPQWVGEDGVEAVVILAIDDMRADQTARYEAYLRPILNRLKAIDGRAPVSIMTCTVKPDDPQLQTWLHEGVNLDVHTLTHPCPLLRNDDFQAAAESYHGCVDLLNQVPNNRPVAYRMPCCDSLNSVSPRFFAGMFLQSTGRGAKLAIDSSVFNVLTPAAPQLPRALVEDADGREKFRKYLPFKSFVNTIENYPYPYVIGGLCWEFPCVVPSDWEAQNVRKPNNPGTVEDLKAALDAIVLEQGVFTMVFHPHGWIENAQIVQLIDHAVQKHGKKVKFLNFREALERLERNLLNGSSLRGPGLGGNGTYVLDINNDGFQDVAILNDQRFETRIWRPARGDWELLGLPEAPAREVMSRFRKPPRAAFGTMGADHRTALILQLDLNDQPQRGGNHPGAPETPESIAQRRRAERDTLSGYRFDGERWRRDDRLLNGLEIDGKPLLPALGDGSGFRLRDIDGDGQSEFLAAPNRVFRWSGPDHAWKPLNWSLPERAVLPGSIDHDAGTRFVDLDEDGRDDLIVSDESGFGVYLFDSIATGWSRRVLSGRPGDPGAFPPLVRAAPARADGAAAARVWDNGFWAHSRHLWWQNENTARLPDLVDRRAFNDLLKDVDPGARSPKAALESIRVRPGFKVETAACEPLLGDPIAFDWGADGKLWVVEMGDYPLGIDGKGQHGGIVRFLEDTDHDGAYDKMTVFLDKLGFPTGVMPWRKGVLVACAPDIIYAEDTNGDGKADLKQVLFTGFIEGNQQHRLNGFELGLDGWVYGANGDSGGNVKSLARGTVTPIGGRDFRFKPDTGEFEAESGQTQFGRHRDDWGRWFGNNNPNIAWQYVLSEQDLKRNPRFAPRDVRKMLDLDTEVHPISRTLPRFNEINMANRITSANSPTPYRDDLFGKPFENNLFVSEPVHNLVRRVVLEPDGATLKGHRFADEADREFLASSDNWFRPTMMKTGPDGALWIADMYRAVIEHPEWVPDDWEARLDLRAGHDQGRIYRVAPVHLPRRPIPRLDALDTAGLVAALDGPNGWQRDTAQRLLLHGNDPAAIGPLRRLAVSSTNPRTRVQALWTLECLGALTMNDVATALNHPNPLVRANAVRMGRGLLATDSALGGRIARLAEDPDPQVRLAVALALGDWNDPKAAQALATIARIDAADPWTRDAILTSAGPHAAGILAELFAQKAVPSLPGPFVQALFALVGPSDPAHGARRLIRLVSTPTGPAGGFAAWQFAALSGLLDAADRDQVPLEKQIGDDDENARGARDALDALFASARRQLTNPNADEELALAALRLLGRQANHLQDDRDQLGTLLKPQVPPRIQREAVAVLSRLRDPKLADRLLAGWKGHSPALRNQVLDVLLSRADGTKALLSALEDTCVPAAEIGPAHRQRLLALRDPELRKRAEALFATTATTRSEVLERYQSALNRPGNPAAGAELFKKHCATCHQLKGAGHDVGPNLAELTDRSPEALLIALLDPNRAFEAKFAAYTIATRDGRVLTGLIAAETATSLTLKGQDGKEETVLRADIDQVAASGQSLMPEGVEKDLSPQDIADLIAYLRQ